MKKGFTLVELLVVIAIIAALAGFAIANLGSAEKATANASVKSDTRNAVTQAMVYKANNAGATPLIGDDGFINLTAEAVSKPVGPLTVQIGPFNGIEGMEMDCDDGTIGYEVIGSSQKTPIKYHYVSCTGKDMNGKVMSATASVQKLDAVIGD